MDEPLPSQIYQVFRAKDYSTIVVLAKDLSNGTVFTRDPKTGQHYNKPVVYARQVVGRFKRKRSHLEILRCVYGQWDGKMESILTPELVEQWLGDNPPSAKDLLTPAMIWRIKEAHSRTHR